MYIKLDSLDDSNLSKWFQTTLKGSTPYVVSLQTSVEILQTLKNMLIWAVFKDYARLNYN